MDNLLYITSSGAENTFYAQSINANNLANVSTTGFRAELVDFESTPMYGETYPTRVYAVAKDSRTDFTPGALIPTHRDLDVAIKGEGLFSVLNQNNQPAFTRNGSFKISAEGQLLTESGLPVLGDGGEISIPPAQKIEIGVDGTISYVPLESDSGTLVQLDRLKLVNPDRQNLYKNTDGLIYTRDGVAPEQDISVSVATGFLESSNVNAVESITNMIGLARQFEIQLKLIKVAEQNDEASTSILNLG